MPPEPFQINLLFSEKRRKGEGGGGVGVLLSLGIDWSCAQASHSSNNSPTPFLWHLSERQSLEQNITSMLAALIV